MARRRGGLLGLVSGALATAGVAAAVAKLNKTAKEEGKDILDVAAEKVNGVVDSVKSGELQQNVVNYANKTVEQAKSGELQKNVTEFANKTVEQVKSGELVDKAVKYATDVKDNLVDLVNTSVSEAEEVVETEVEQEAAEAQEQPQETEE